MNPTRFEAEVVRTIRGLGPGQLAAYGEIAEEAGYPRAGRAVGAVLSRADDLPWWRVVRADGRLAAHKVEEQAHRLRAEGVTVVDGRVRRSPA